MNNLMCNPPEKSDESKAFQHAPHIGQAHALPHSLKDQVKRGVQSANVTAYDSHKAATHHEREHSLLLSPDEDNA